MVTGWRAVVVAHPFVERVADAVRDAAVDLALDHHRIDQHAGVLHRDVAQDFHLAGLDVDLDLGDVAGVGVGQRIGAVHDVGFEAGIDAGRKAVARRALQDARDLARA